MKSEKVTVGWVVRWKCADYGVDKALCIGPEGSWQSGRHLFSSRAQAEFAMHLELFDVDPQAFDGEMGRVVLRVTRKRKTNPPEAGWRPSATAIWTVRGTDDESMACLYCGTTCIGYVEAHASAYVVRALNAAEAGR